MLYQLPNGKTIEITLEQFLAMTDEDIEYLIAYGHGEEINNPFAGSALENPSFEKDIRELPDIPVDEKLSDPDFRIDE
jgi:hypothetical protein